MRFNQPRQIIKPVIASVVSREIRKQQVDLRQPTKDHLKQIHQVTTTIKEKGVPDHLVRKKLPNGLGDGIFLHPKAKPIKKGQVIAPYSGEVSLCGQDDFDDSLYAFSCLTDIRLSKKEHPHVDKKHRYNPRRLYELKLDAERKGNFTRFINHSNNPNVVAELVKIPPNSLGIEPNPVEVVYFAKKTIRPGEQLLVSYEGEEDTYWGAMGVDPLPMTPTTYILSESLKVVPSNKK